jgi:tetratricopeptide (TPR) repeat protein
VEELVGMLLDEGLLERRNGDWIASPGLADLTVPPTLRELLGARLDRMPAGERAALERGSVEGQVFHRGAVDVLSEASQRADVTERLNALVEKEFLHAAPADFVDEAAYRFRHILIRDAAYEALPKKLRSALHERFADWLEERAGDRVSEFDEILGYHLEQAYRLREELGPVTDDDRALALRAAERLEHAGRRALDRRDSTATVNLLSRAAGLLPGESERRFELLQFAGEELGFMMELDRASEAFRQVIDGAGALENRLLETHGRIWQSVMTFWGDPDFGVRELLAAADDAAQVFEELDDARGLARTHDWRAFTYSHMGRYADSEEEAARAIELFRRIGDRRLAVEQFWYLGWAAAYGPRPVEDGIAQCMKILEDAGDDKAVEGHTQYSLAVLQSLRGRFDEARELAERGRAVFEQTGMLFTVWYLVHRGTIERLAGNADEAERELRKACDQLEAAFDFPSLTNAATALAELLVEQGRVDEASELLGRAREWVPKDQAPHHARWRAAQARVLARQGDPGAEALAREAVALAGKTDFLALQGDCLLALADVLGDGAEARPAMEDAVERYERKGSTVLAERARALLSPTP